MRNSVPPEKRSNITTSEALKNPASPRYGDSRIERTPYTQQKGDALFTSAPESPLTKYEADTYSASRIRNTTTNTQPNRAKTEKYGFMESADSDVLPLQPTPDPFLKKAMDDSVISEEEFDDARTAKDHASDDNLRPKDTGKTRDDSEDEDFFYDPNAGKKIIDIDKEQEQEKDKGKSSEKAPVSPTPKLDTAINTLSNTQKIVSALSILTIVAGAAMLVASLVFPISLPAATVVLTVGISTLAGTLFLGQAGKSALKRARSVSRRQSKKGKTPEVNIEKQKTNRIQKNKESAIKKEMTNSNNNESTYRFNPAKGFEKTVPSKKIPAPSSNTASLGFSEFEQIRRANKTKKISFFDR